MAMHHADLLCRPLVARDGVTFFPTHHLLERSEQRRISVIDIKRTLTYGRRVYSRGALYFVIGKREVRKHRRKIDLQAQLGCHVVCHVDGVVKTAFWNKGLFVTSSGRRRRRQ